MHVGFGRDGLVSVGDVGVSRPRGAGRHESCDFQGQSCLLNDRFCHEVAEPGCPLNGSDRG